MSDRGKWTWKALPWGLYTTCTACGDVRHCRGKARERMVCLECFALDGAAVKLRRGGKPGKRSGYTFQTRRPREQTLALVRELRDRGLVVGAIADELGLSEKSVRNYFAKVSGAEKTARNSFDHAASRPTKRTRRVVGHPGGRE